MARNRRKVIVKIRRNVAIRLDPKYVILRFIHQTYVKKIVCNIRKPLKNLHKN